MRTRISGIAQRRARGFTLLEVIVAMTITGFVLGGLFSLVAGSKQLSWRAEDNLQRASRIRAATNFALLQNDYQAVQTILRHDDYRIEALERIEDPLRKTEPTTWSLQRYEIVHAEREESLPGLRFIRLELPQ